MTGRRRTQCNHAERGAARPSAVPEFGNSAVNAAMSLALYAHEAPTSGYIDCIVFCTSAAFECDIIIPYLLQRRMRSTSTHGRHLSIRELPGLDNAKQGWRLQHVQIAWVSATLSTSNA